MDVPQIDIDEAAQLLAHGAAAVIDVRQPEEYVEGHVPGAPLIPLAEGVLAMPLIGTIDAARAAQILDTLLDGVAAQRARVAILDIIGVRLVDAQVASALLNAARAVRLLGAHVILTGIRAEVAQALVHIGADLGDLTTRSTLQSGIASALKLLAPG